MANYDAQINILVGGINRINDLENRLSRIQDTIEEINSMGAEGVFGRTTNLGVYSRALREINATADAVRRQTAEQQQANSATRDQLLLYSRLNREQNLFRRRSAAFTEESKGVRETNSRVIELTTQLRSAQRAFSALFADADVQGIRVLNTEISALLEELREINRVATGTKNVGANTAQLQAQADGWAGQIRVLRQRASALEENEEILARIAIAERNLIQLRNADMSFREDANVRLGKQELANASALIKAEENLASVRRRDAADYERQINRQSGQIKNVIQLAAKAVKAAGSATLDAVTFGKGSQVARGARNAAIRGGLGLGALGAGGLYEGFTQGITGLGDVNLGPANIFKGPVGAAASFIGDSINSALGGVPEIIGNLLSALGDIPGALGLASVAALAFAPAMKTAGEAVYLAGKKFGESKFGENIKLTLDRQTNLFESVINKASEMNMVLDASKSGLDAVGQAVQSLPALPAAGQTSFKGEIRQVADRRTLRAIEEAKARNEVFPEGITTTFIGGGARALKNAEFLADSTGKIAARSQEAADATLFLAERLGAGSTEAGSFANRLELGAQEAKKIAEYLEQAKNLRISSIETPTRRFVRENIERGRGMRENQQSAEIARERSAALLGGQYSLSQVPARGELFPGGRTETRQPNYREMLNNQALIRQYVNDILETMSKQQRSAATLEQLERRTLGNVSEIVAARRSSLDIMQKEVITQERINAENERSIQIIRERNKELRQRPIAAMTPQERGVLLSEGGGLRLREGNILDPASLRADRFRRIKTGRARKEAITRATSEGLIGGAFPLLFGQGIGASIGGLAGGVSGGLAGGGLGFGLSLIGTALGTAIDQLGAKATETGQSLRYPAESFEKIKQAGLLANRQQEYYIQKLIESGRIAEANGEIQKEIIKKIGVSGINDLTKLGDSSSKLSKAWAELNLQLQTALAGPLAGLLDWVANVIKLGNEVGREAVRQQEILNGLSPEKKKKLLGEQSRISQGMTIFNEAQKNKQISELYTRFAPLSTPQTPAATQLTPEQKEVISRAQALTRELQAQADLAAKQLSLAGLTLEKDGARYINASRAVALQEYENKLLAIKDDWIGKIFNKEQNTAKIRAANLEYAARLSQINQEIAAQQERYNQALANAISQLLAERQNAISIAVRRAEFDDGELAAIEKQLSLLGMAYEARQQILEIERTSAMVEAAKNGTTEQINQLFDFRIQNLERERLLEEDILNQKAAQIKAEKEIAKLQARNEARMPFKEFRANTELDLIYGQKYYSLLRQGIRPAEAQRIAEFEKLSALQKSMIEQQILMKELEIDAAKRAGLKTRGLEFDLELLKIRQGVISGEAQKGPGSVATKIPGLEIQEFISQATEDLNNLEAVAIRVSQGIGDALGNSLANGISGLVEGTATAKEIFANFLKDVSQILLQEAGRMIATYIAIGIAKSFAGLNGGGGGGGGSAVSDSYSQANMMKDINAFPIKQNANGNAYGYGKIMPFAMGGIVNSPTLFKFANGGTMSAGVMGEAGPEAILPLKRGSDGKLGVEASGTDGGVNVVVNVDAKGTSVQGNSQSGNELGRAVSAAVQQELIRQKRPGGLLA